jgi:hypothetical protein
VSEDFLSASYVPFCLDGLHGRNGTSGVLGFRVYYTYSQLC